MNNAQQKVVQYLDEAHATEQALVRVLQSQIAMTPRGSYRSGLETHLRETREHAARVADRLDGLGHGSNPLMAVAGVAAASSGRRSRSARRRSISCAAPAARRRS